MKKVINIIVGLIGLIAQVVSMYYGIACTVSIYSNFIRYTKVGMCSSIITIICIVYLIVSSVSLKTTETNHPVEENK